MAPRLQRLMFLPPAGYRQKRIRDAAHLLPALGGALLLVPLLWSPSNAPEGVGNSTVLIYVFAVWAGLILAAFVLTRALRLESAEDPRSDDEIQ